MLAPHAPPARHRAGDGDPPRRRAGGRSARREGRAPRRRARPRGRPARGQRGLQARALHAGLHARRCAAAARVGHERDPARRVVARARARAREHRRGVRRARAHPGAPRRRRGPVGAGRHASGPVVRALRRQRRARLGDARRRPAVRGDAVPVRLPAAGRWALVRELLGQPRRHPRRVRGRVWRPGQGARARDRGHRLRRVQRAGVRADGRAVRRAAPAGGGGRVSAAVLPRARPCPAPRRPERPDLLRGLADHRLRLPVRGARGRGRPGPELSRLLRPADPSRAVSRAGGPGAGQRRAQRARTTTPRRW